MDGAFTLHSYTIRFEKENQPIYLIPLGDIHRFADNHDEKRYLKMLEWIKKKNCYVLGMGDYDDFASTGERAGLRGAKLHSTSNRWLDDVCRERALKFAKEWEPFKDRIIGMIEGNHHYVFSDGITSTQLMCQYLGVKYLGLTSAILLKFIGRSNKSANLTIFAHHGLGGGRRTGSSVNKVEDMERVLDADIYLMGHDHKKFLVNNSKLYLSNKLGNLKLKKKKILLARTGSFQLGYVDGHDNYPSSLLMPPSDLGCVKIEMTPTRVTHKKKEQFFMDVHASI